MARLAQTAKENAVDEAMTMMFGNLRGVVGSLINTAQSGGLSSVAASRTLLSYTLGDPAKHMAQVGEQPYQPKTFADFMLDAQLRSEGVAEAEIQRQVSQLKR